MIQIVQLHGTDKKLYELVAPLVMSPEVLKQNYNYPFRTSEEYEWFVALDNKHVVGFVPVEHKKYECVINNYYIKERNVDTLKLLLEKVLEKQDEESSLTAVSFVEDRDVFSELGFLEEALLHAKGKIMINLDQADLYFDQIYELMKKTGTTKQIIMKGRKTAAEVKKQFGDYLNDVIYMPIVDLDKPGAEEQIETFVKEMSPVAFELLYVKDSNPLPKKLATTLADRSLIWYNTLWDTMAGGHDDDMSLQNPDEGYGYLIDTLGCRILQTDRPAYLLEYLRTKKMHE